MNRKEHWENVYATKTDGEVSWTQADPRTSLTLINLDDWRLLGNCVTGPGRTLNLGCEALDADLDGDVDLQDFAAFQLGFNSVE